MTSCALDEALLPGTSQGIRERYASFAARAATATFGLDEPEVVVLDTETTGLSLNRDELIEIAAVIMKGPAVVASFQTFVNPLKPLPAEISALTGIVEDDLQGAPTPDEALRQLADFVGDRDIIAHNAAFDSNFIMRHAAPGQVTGDWLDSLELSRIALPRMRSHRLAALVEVFGAPESTHRAMDDVLALCAIWRIMLVALSDFTPGLLASIRDLHPRIDWPLRKVIARIAAQDPTPAITLGELRAKALHQESGTIKLDAQDQTLCFAPREDIARCFQPDSMLSAMYPGFEPRAEQVEMACEVQRAFSTDGISAIEAGTGVGKSMAYLLPAALLAQGNGIGVGVATKTNALMDQLIYNELPRLAKQLPQGLRYVAIKGYEHYPCLRKMQAMASMDPEPSEDEDGKRRDLARITLLASIYAFLDQSAWADFDAIPLHWSDLPRKAICASSGDCLHNRCRFFPQFCLIHGLRQMARCADIVVTNHALLFRDAASEGALLPPIRHWIVDEAHAVEDEARKQLSLCADVRDLRGELAHLAKGPSSVMAHAIRKAKQVEGGQLITICAVKVEEEANRCDAIAESFFSFVKDLAEHAEKSSYDVVELWVNEQLRETGTWSVVAGTGRSLANHLTTLTDLCKELLSCIDSQESRLWDVAADVKGSCCHLEEARDAVDLCVNVQDPDYVYSASLNRRPDVPAEALNASLLDVGNALNQLFYPRVQSVVYTSATIATGESFEHFNHAVGLDLQEAGRCRSLKLSSSYDFQRNMTVLLPYDMPDPTCGKLYTEALCDLLLDVHEAMGGSTLTLFTNRKEMEHVYNAIHPRLNELGIPLLCQSKGYSAKRLRDEFLANKQTSLFALKSFWEGFDAPGDTLRCVVIPKLPFARPTDPLYLERELRERNAWQRYSLPEAILDLKQAAGRLIRSSTDRGVLLLCDSRLLTKFYGARFLGSLPSQNQLRLSVDDVGAFLRSWE